MEGWPAPSWHVWHRNGVRILRSAGCAEPCASWQLAQSSATGWCSHKKGPRNSAWQLVQVSVTVFLTNCAGAVEPCGEWQEVQAIFPSRSG